GAYAIQGFFGKYVKKINGDYYNVMGLPLNRLYRELSKFR
ncbi:MAG: Maf family protein, partial [Bacilli bacterium]